MTESANEIFEDVVTKNVEICRRCFKPSQPTKEQDSVGGGASCSDDCGTLSITLETDPINRGEIEVRAPRLLPLIQQAGYEIDEAAYTDAIDLLSDIPEPPQSIFLDAIRAGSGEASTQDLLKKHDLESEEARRTQKILRELPTSNISEKDLKMINDQVASEIQTLADSRSPGSSIYYLPDSATIPEKYQSMRFARDRPKHTMRTVIEENESWFWNTSAKNVDDWLDELDAEFEECAASCLYQYIKSRQRRTATDSPPPDEQFRKTSLWVVFKDDLENIMGFLRRHDSPQSAQEIAEYADLSESTVRTLLSVVESAQPVGENDLWKPTDYTSSR
jgi:hypothetical protein